MSNLAASLPPLARDLPAADHITRCATCPNDVDTDSARFDSPHSDSWQEINGKVYCPDCWLSCDRCGEPTLIEGAACVRDGDYHCPDCECGECNRYARSER